MSLRTNILVNAVGAALPAICLFFLPSGTSLFEQLLNVGLLLGLVFNSVLLVLGVSALLRTG